MSPAIITAICLLAAPVAYAADIKLSVSAFYRERIALPPDAALHVELIDMAEPEAVLGTATVAPSGQVPSRSSEAGTGSSMSVGKGGSALPLQFCQ
ncbi:YbaY family lipoprotein [Mesorhizobium sp. AR07]|nr:YbaY family lipoprotein [Mesorhizobium sp. AR07]